MPFEILKKYISLIVKSAVLFFALFVLQFVSDPLLQDFINLFCRGGFTNIVTGFTVSHWLYFCYSDL